MLTSTASGLVLAKHNLMHHSFPTMLWRRASGSVPHISGFSEPSARGGFRALTLTVYLLLFSLVACAQSPILPGAYQLDRYLPLLENKNVALVVNHTSLVNETHLVDTLLGSNIQVDRIFAPEHGFRGEAGAGEIIQDGTDATTGLPIVSLYGKNKKPTAEQLKGVDVVVFDIQDVGARFYTYISTMHYVMEACAEQNKPLIILDRPNPNGYYVDGPVLDTALRSFVGMHPIPIVHGLTVGELAQMINGEGWLANSVQCAVQIIPVQNYTHSDRYHLPVRPSPNLPNNQAINLYPSLCLLEGTVMSLGRGTDFPFQVMGYPNSAFRHLANESFTFTPRSIPGVAPDPKHQAEKCYGVDLRTAPKLDHFSLQYVLDSYREAKKAGINDFFNAFFDKLAGTAQLKKQIMDGLNEEQIRASWEPFLGQYKKMRKQYLLYRDFE